MKQYELCGYILTSVIGLCLSTLTVASDIQPCDTSTKSSGRILKVKGTGINVRKGPGTNFNKIKNEKTSQILKKIVYVTIDKSVTVREECTKAGWSKIQVTKPGSLSKTHRGWVASRFLRSLQTANIGGAKYSDWHTDFNMDVTKVLVSNKIRGCGEYKYRVNLSKRNEYLVHCTRDGKNWVPYLVSTSNGTAKRQ